MKRTVAVPLVSALVLGGCGELLFFASSEPSVFTELSAEERAGYLEREVVVDGTISRILFERNDGPSAPAVRIDVNALNAGSLDIERIPASCIWAVYVYGLGEDGSRTLVWTDEDYGCTRPGWFVDWPAGEYLDDLLTKPARIIPEKVFWNGEAMQTFELRMVLRIEASSARPGPRENVSRSREFVIGQFTLH